MSRWIVLRSCFLYFVYHAICFVSPHFRFPFHLHFIVSLVGSQWLARPGVSPCGYSYPGMLTRQSLLDYIGKRLFITFNAVYFFLEGTELWLLEASLFRQLLLLSHNSHKSLIWPTTDQSQNLVHLTEAQRAGDCYDHPHHKNIQKVSKAIQFIEIKAVKQPNNSTKDSLIN